MTPSEVNVDQTVAYAADQFEIALVGSETFLAQPDFATIDLGFLDSILVPQLVNSIEGGVIDEVELHVEPRKQTSVLRGRDAASIAADSTVYVTYAAGQSQVPDSPPLAEIPGFPTLPATPGVTIPIILPGPWTARHIAEDLCQRVGLRCSYNAPDYILREDVAVNGPILSAIHTLVEPFSRFERSKVDIWVEGDPDGNMLVVRSRGAGGAGVALNAHDTRITNLLIRSKFLGYIRVIRLTGAEVFGASPAGIAVDPGDDDSETSDELEVDGAIVSRVVTRETRRILDRAVKSQTIETYKDSGSGLSLISSVETTSLWDDLVLAFPNRIVNNPKERLRTIITSGPDEDGTFGPLRRTRVAHAYDANGFLSAQETIEDTFEDGDWEKASSETKQYRDNGANMYQITTTQYSADGAPGATRRTTALGSRPGGPGRSVARGTGSRGASVTYGAIISEPPGAKDLSLSNASLLLPELQLIAAQAAAASGATEHEVSFTAAGMPWLRRGQYLHLTGLTRVEDGSSIPVQSAIVSEAKQEYRESDEGQSYLTHVRALYWTP